MERPRDLGGVRRRGWWRLTFAIGALMVAGGVLAHLKIKGTHFVSVVTSAGQRVQL
ncbi:MAG: hypothetical protein KF819_26835 [Labilithrix sp.]|nr:hypothetical protein [Labilithrix sp.]